MPDGRSPLDLFLTAYFCAVGTTMIVLWTSAAALPLDLLVPTAAAGFVVAVSLVSLLVLPNDVDSRAPLRRYGRVIIGVAVAECLMLAVSAVSYSSDSWILVQAPILVFVVATVVLLGRSIQGVVLRVFRGRLDVSGRLLLAWLGFFGALVGAPGLGHEVFWYPAVFYLAAALIFSTVFAATLTLLTPVTSS